METQKLLKTIAEGIDKLQAMINNNYKVSGGISRYELREIESKLKKLINQVEVERMYD